VTAEFYSANLAGEIRKGMTQKAKMGGWPTKAPIGYLNVREKIAGKEIAKVILDPGRALLVRETFRLYATGEYSLPELQATMHAKGLTSPYARKPGAPVSVSKLAELLTNQFYVGVVQWGGARYPGQHKPLIPQSLFDRVQETIRSRDVAGVRQRRHEQYLKGLLHCGDSEGAYRSRSPKAGTCTSTAWASKGPRALDADSPTSLPAMPRRLWRTCIEGSSFRHRG
jgi:hypothetical protein